MGQWNGSSTMVRAPYRDNGRVADVVWFPSVPADVPSRFLASARAVAPEVLGDWVDPPVHRVAPRACAARGRTHRRCRGSGAAWMAPASQTPRRLPDLGWGDEMYFDMVAEMRGTRM